MLTSKRNAYICDMIKHRTLTASISIWTSGAAQQIYQIYLCSEWRSDFVIVVTLWTITLLTDWLTYMTSQHNWMRRPQNDLVLLHQHADSLDVAVNWLGLRQIWLGCRQPNHQWAHGLWDAIRCTQVNHLSISLSSVSQPHKLLLTTLSQQAPTQTVFLRMA